MSDCNIFEIIMMQQLDLYFKDIFFLFDIKLVFKFALCQTDGKQRNK